MRLTTKPKDGKHFVSNAPIEDIIPYCNVLDNKADGILRLGFQNVHGTHLTPSLHGMEETDAMLSLQLDVLGLAETNLS